MISRSTFALAVVALVAPAQAQDAPPPAFPEAEIFLFDYDSAAAKDALSNGRNVTQRAGYDNQPYFMPDGASFVYSRDDGTQTDVWSYDLASGAHRQVTRTPENEFSPTPSPDGRTISMVYERNRSVWEIDVDAPDAPRFVLEAAGVDEPVGYFARNHATGDVLFWSRFGYNVALSHDARARYDFVSGHAVPATPHLVPGTGEFSFVHRQTNEEVWIKAVDPETRAVRPLAPLVGTNANHAFAPDGAILQIENGTLYRWPKGGEKWDKVADLEAFGLASANRIAVRPDGRMLAIVGVPKD